MNSAMLQSQQKLNAEVLTFVYSEINSLRKHRAMYLEDKEFEQAALYTPWINKMSKKARRLEELQRFTKRQLQEAYTIEQFEKTYCGLGGDYDDGNFLLDRARMAAEDGFVEPGVVYPEGEFIEVSERD